MAGNLDIDKRHKPKEDIVKRLKLYAQKLKKDGIKGNDKGQH